MILFAGSRRLVGLTPTIFFFAPRALALKIGVKKRNDVAALVADKLAGLMQHGTKGLFTDAIRAPGFRGHEWWFDDISGSLVVMPRPARSWNGHKQDST